MSQIKYKCDYCSHVFKELESRCENWRETDKCFICPNCNHYLKKVNYPDIKYTREAWFISLLGLVIFGLLKIWSFVKGDETIFNSPLILLFLIPFVISVAYVRFGQYWHMHKVASTVQKTKNLGKSDLD